MRILAGIGALAIIVAVGAAIFFFGGFFNIAANEEDPAIVNWALIKVRMASIARHARLVDNTPNLEDPEFVHAGARAFATRGCVNCHGAPGVNWQKFSEGQNPDPPDLKDVVKEREPAQLFWVISHGIKMTGMPSFSAIGVDDKEIWSIVAFARKLPNVSEADFKAWTATP
jgi:mono/diheme cytochrome c family protein